MSVMYRLINRSMVVPTRRSHAERGATSSQSWCGRKYVGAMADFGVYSPHSRTSVLRTLNWRHYKDKLPPARTIANKNGSTSKVFEWRLLLKDVDGRTKFVESNKGNVVSFTEHQLDACDIIRTKWLLKTFSFRNLFRYDTGKSSPGSLYYSFALGRHVSIFSWAPEGSSILQEGQSNKRGRV